ncbi:hypothetical protein LH407_11970 [Antiquaquibacter oligotrophicus]|nr:hypothetical protein [Antiquaquibacter oligotrophicus]UDF12863.1 hypothetical protein LH407_11970 [Antiquaquibacter oligotrophicus]
MTTSPFPVSELYARDLAVWDQWGGQIDDCFVAFTVGPYAPFVGHSDAADDDEIWYLIAHSDWEENSTAYQSLRLFDDTSAATRHMAEVAQSAATCAEQTTSLTRFPGNVSQLAALELPESVAAVGVVAESTPGRGWRVYSWDVQRGNAVARLQIYTDGTTTDQHVRAIAEKYAAELASISPER